MLFPLALMFILSLLPQGDTGQLTGTVVDANDAAIVSAHLRLINQTTSQVRELATGDSGNFAFTLLQPGRYKLEVSANCFRTTLVEDVHVNITQPQRCWFISIARPVQGHG